MPDYKEQTTQAKSWQRCYRMVCENVRGQQPFVECLEEVVTEAGDAQTSRQVPGCKLMYDPDGDPIDMRDPLTGEKVGATMSQVEVYAVLYSLYRHAADTRDAQANQEEGGILPPV